MGKLTKAKAREIIDDFATEIRERKVPGPKPAMAVIDFRTEKQSGTERDVFHVPIELLRYRKDNGRIASDVLDYERHRGILIESSQGCQDKLKSFLYDKDREKTDELAATIEHTGQQEPAIITCDGFLINGNRRKMVHELLKEKFPGNPKYEFMKVVILPGKTEDGGPPTLLEIEQIENRYQLQSDGKAEYYGFDRALSIRKKVQLGMTVESQLKDDPVYANLEGKEFKKEVVRFKNTYLHPLKCIDRYLDSLDRTGLYSTIARGMGDSEGRWQAFIDYADKYPQFSESVKRMKIGISEEEVGKIEQCAFTIIRKRDFSAIGLKAHKIMRELPKWLSNKGSKQELLKLADIPYTLSLEERTDKDGNDISERDQDRKWGAKHSAEIINHVKKARGLYEHKKDRETPLNGLCQ